MVRKLNYESDEVRWRAVKAKDARADGRFFFGVRTTNVYCRPNCAAKLPLRENVAFFSTSAEAESAGFRACKRCRPGGVSAIENETRLVDAACEQIRKAEEPVPLSELARSAGLSRSHFQRIFKRRVGVTPRQLAQALRDERARSALRTESSVTGAIYEAGFGASSRFYERAPEILGMTPREYRTKGKGLKIQYAIAKSALGMVLIAGTERGIACVQFGEDREELKRLLKQCYSGAEIVPGAEGFCDWTHAVLQKIARPETDAKIPLDIRGTIFQRRIWELLRDIPLGETTSYTEVAGRLGNPEAVRAVARACAANPLAVLVPCHRVVRKNGDLAGYRWGLERKRKLLEVEKVRMEMADAK